MAYIAWLFINGWFIAYSHHSNVFQNGLSFDVVVGEAFGANQIYRGARKYKTPRKGFSINSKAKKPFTLIELVGKVVLIGVKKIIFGNKGLLGKTLIKGFVFY